MKDPFDQNIEDVDLVYLRLPHEHEPELWFDGDRFMRYLRHNFDFLDVATYSFSVFPQLKIRRLITGLSFRHSFIKCEMHKQVRNNHCKIFLCYKEATFKPIVAFLGSQNLTSGTNFNLMYKVKAKHLSPILTFFNSMWKAKT